MKKILFLLVSAFALCTSNVCATNGQQTTVAQVENNPQVCKFSLDHYRGTIGEVKGEFGKCTQPVMVMLSCPQPEDVTATVDVYVDGERVASKLFTISAGKKESNYECINVPEEYDGKKYVLEVE